MPNEETIEKPKTAETKKVAEENFVIHVMPKEFLGKVAAVKEKPVEKKPVVPPPPPPPPPKPKPKPLPKPTPKKKSKTPFVLLAIGFIFITVLIVGGYFVLQGIQEEPTPIVTPEPPEPPDEPIVTPEPPPPPPVEPGPGKDTDSDGLTDTEERLYGTDFRNPDTDGDTFLDGNEVFHRFDPLGFSPSTLLDTGSVKIYDGINFRLTYPAGWAVQVSDDQYAYTIPGSTADIVVSVSAKSIEQSIEDWYETEIAPENGAADIAPMISKNGYHGLTSSDELVTYLDGGVFVYTIMYDLNDEISVEYLQTFQMMINSFELMDEDVE